MATRWERLAGDTSVFALKVSFSPDPDAGAASHPDEAISWGGFQIWVEGRNLCAHQDGGERFASVHWYLLPLFEWFAANWDPLLHEEKLPVKNAAETAWQSLRQTRFPPFVMEDDNERSERWERDWHFWYFRHCLYVARRGGLFPEILIRRWRDSVEISWGSSSERDAEDSFRFLDGKLGVARVPPKLVAEALEEVLAGAAQYLVDQSPKSERLQALRKAVKSLRKPDEIANDRLAWLAGLGVDAPGFRKGWKRVREQFKDLPEKEMSGLFGADVGGLVVEGSCHAALMYGTVAPTLDESSVLGIAKAMIELHEPGTESEKLKALVRSEPIADTGPSWEQGYELAQEVLEEVSQLATDEVPVDMDSVLAELGVDVHDLELSDCTIRGLAVAGSDFRPGIRVNVSHEANGYPSGRRFTLAHELCHLLFDREAGRRLAIASGPWAPRDVERRANAFAAMLLMPRDLVAKVINELKVKLETKEGIAQVAKHLGASFDATLWHLTNLGFLDDYVRQRISSETYQAALKAER
jgi:Zn-dependent peptidase ImmA (M78 family)